jgi:dTDP-glucose pyrophosphorylase
MESNIKDFFIPVTESIINAMKQLDVTGEKILFVVCDNDKLFGTLTDGDIRRWILSGGSLSETVDKICNQKPMFVYQDYDPNSVKQKMLETKLECIPVISDDNTLVQLLFKKDLFEEPHLHKIVDKIDVPVVIMAGGKGTRLDPFTKILPKPLIPIGDKSVIEIIMDKFVEYGINRFHISINHKSKIIKSYFEEIKADYQLNFIEEEKALGTAGSLTYINGIIKETFIVTNCDIIIDANYKEMLDFHKKNKNDLTLVASIKKFSVPYGVCEIENGGVLLKINEKPSFTFLVNTGMYYLEPALLDMIPKSEFFHMTHLIEKVKENGGKVGIFPISENSWIDTGEWEEYRRAVAKFQF